MRGIDHGLARHIDPSEVASSLLFFLPPLFPQSLAWMMAGIASHGLVWLGLVRPPPTNTFRGRPLASSGSSHWQAGKLAQGTGPLSRALGDLTIFDLTGHATRDESGRTQVTQLTHRTGVLYEFLQTEVLTGAYGCTLQSAQLLELGRKHSVVV
jgi:hypothetical protein